MRRQKSLVYTKEIDLMLRRDKGKQITHFFLVQGKLKKRSTLIVRQRTRGSLLDSNQRKPYADKIPSFFLPHLCNRSFYAPCASFIYALLDYDDPVAKKVIVDRSFQFPFFHFCLKKHQ